MTQSVPAGEVRLLGDRAFLVGLDDAAAARLLASDLTAAWREAGLFDSVDVVSGSATVLVHVTDHDLDLLAVRETVERVGADLARRPASESAAPPGRLITLACRFDGEDLGEVATLAGCAQDDVVGFLTAQPLTASVIGFSPGFAYLDGLPEPLRSVPRRARPRTAVPAGSVAVANGHAAVYPTASPGGWHLVGRTAFPLFTPTRPPYAVLAPGDRVRLRLAAADEDVVPGPVEPPQWSLPPQARPVCEVVVPGLRAVLQDAGRRHVAAAGVPTAGPADPFSFELANRLVGNAPGAGTIEVTGGGTRLRALGMCHVAAVGAAPVLSVDGDAAPAGRLLPLRGGQVFDIGRQQAGCRTYLAVAGGFLGPEWFGSSATDQLTALGAGNLGQGQVLHAGPWTPPLGDHLRGAGPTDTDPGSVVALRVLPGPHPEQFDAAAMTILRGAEFVAQPESNRVGLRLRADRPLAVRRDGGGGALDSHGVVTGAVQLPPDGDPVVLLPDHATLGGYPVLAVVVAADLGLLGQCAPGTRIRLVPVSVAEADEARHSARRELADAVAGTYPLAVD